MRGAICILLGIAACGGGGGDDGDDGVTIDARPNAIDARSIDAQTDASVPPDAGPPPDAEPPGDATLTSSCDLTAGGGSAVLYLSFDGETLVPGADDATTNTFFYSPSPSSTVPAWRAGAPDRAALIEHVACDVRAALEPFDVRVVTTRPANGNYQMIVIGGLPNDIAAPFGVPAVALKDCTAANPRNVGWIAERTFPNSPLQTLNETRNLVLAELGLWVGLEISGDAGDCMCVYNNQTCTISLDDCTYGTASTAATQLCAAVATQDEPAKLMNRYGARP